MLSGLRLLSGAGFVFGLILSLWMRSQPAQPEPLRTRPATSLHFVGPALKPPLGEETPLSQPKAAAPPPATSQSSVGPFNLDRRSGLRAAVKARAVRREIVTFTSDTRGLPAAANMALQLSALGITQHMVLADARKTCVTGQTRWAWLGCGWSAGLPGFEERYARGLGGETTQLWSLWSAKWLLVARLVELRVNVLALDTDMMLQVRSVSREDAGELRTGRTNGRTNRRTNGRTD